jgi:hypothetical protein
MVPNHQKLGIILENKVHQELKKLAPLHYVSLQNTAFSSEYVDFWPKLYLNLHHSFKNLTTHITFS